MKRLLFGLIFILFVGNSAQIFALNDMGEYDKAADYLNNKGEVYFRFGVNSRSQIEELTEIISIDKVSYSEVYAYANEKEFERFRQLDIYYEVLPHPGDLLKQPAMSDDPDVIRQEWDKYPTYDGYVSMMYDFETDYPGLCKIHEMKRTTVKGRKQLLAIISDNVDSPEPEPRFLYTSTMHGDETLGYVLMLRLIDHLLSNYPSDAQVKNLVDNIEIWIMPLENPDGTYRTSNNTVSGATRTNGNGIDLNRNFPVHNYVKPIQPETQNYIDLTDSLKFVVSMNFHGGAELLNYPYDNFVNGTKYHPDDDWWQYVLNSYIDVVHDNGPSSYMTQNGGVILGYDWYPIDGSRMDYMTYAKYCLEVTAEISYTKLVAANDLPEFWDYNYKAFFYYIEQSLYGITGTVVDSQTNDPIAARVFIEDHDRDSSWVYSKLPHGDFHRPVYKGTYNVTFSNDDYITKTISNVTVNNEEATVLDVKLWPVDPTGSNAAQKNHKAKISILSHNRGIRITYDNGQYNIMKAAIYDLNGRLIKLIPRQAFLEKSDVIWDGLNNTGKQVGNGCYLVRIVSDNRTHTKSFILSR